MRRVQFFERRNLFGCKPQQVLIHPSGDFMYYLDFIGSLHVEDIKSADGSLTDSGQAAVVASPTASANVGVIDPTGRFIYVISDVGNSIYCFSIAQTTDKATNGALTRIQIVSAPTDPTLNAPTWIMTDRTGNFLYVVNNFGNSVSEYAITQTGASAGALTLLSTTPVSTGAAPFFGTTDVNGHIFVANSGDGTVSVFTIGSGGLLAQVGSLVRSLRSTWIKRRVRRTVRSPLRSARHRRRARAPSVWLSIRPALSLPSTTTSTTPFRCIRSL